MLVNHGFSRKIKEEVRRNGARVTRYFTWVGKSQSQARISNISSHLVPMKLFRNCENGGTFLVVQWLRIYASTIGGLVSIPTRGIKILHATWYGQKTKKKLWKLRPREANNLEEGHRWLPPQCVSTTMMASDLGDSAKLLTFAQLKKKLMRVSEE